MDGVSVEVRGVEDVLKSLPQVDRRGTLAAGGAEYKRLWQKHFRALDGRGNRKGFPSRGFWIDEGFKKTDIAELTDEQVRVAVDSLAVAFRYAGGTIRPRSAKALAIPVSAEAYAAGWPSNSGLPLEFIPINRGRLVGMLVEAAASRIGYTKGGKVKNKGNNLDRVGKKHYLLVKFVTQKGMGDEIMPNRAEAEESVVRKMVANIQMQFKRSQG